MGIAEWITVVLGVVAVCATLLRVGNKVGTLETTVAGHGETLAKVEQATNGTGWIREKFDSTIAKQDEARRQQQTDHESTRNAISETQKMISDMKPACQEHDSRINALEKRQDKYDESLSVVHRRLDRKHGEYED